MRLIDADALAEEFASRMTGTPYPHGMSEAAIEHVLRDAPAVCCGECRYFFWKEENWGDCQGAGLIQPTEDQFCSYFERRGP